MNNTCYLNSGLSNSQQDFYQQQNPKSHLNILEVLSYLNQSQLLKKQNLLDFQIQNQKLPQKVRHFETLVDQNNNLNFCENSPEKYSNTIINQRNQNHDDTLSRNVSKEYILSQLKAQQKLKQIQQSLKEKQNLHNAKNSNEYLRHTFINSAPNFPAQNSISDKLEIFNDGNVKNIPPNLLLDQFGMIGLIMMMKINESNKDLSLIMGQGEESSAIIKSISQNSENDPKLDASKSFNHLEFSDINSGIYNLSEIRSKLPGANTILKNAHDDLLFCIFYIDSNEFHQLLATKMLNSRGWFFNKELYAWLKNNPRDNNSYMIFDFNSWSIQLHTTG